MIKVAVVACLLFCAPLSAWAEEGAITTCSRAEADGSRTLCHEAVLPTSADVIWRRLLATDGLSSWLAPVAAIDLRIGGIREASHQPDERIGDVRNIRNRVLSYLACRLARAAGGHCGCATMTLASALGCLGERRDHHFPLWPAGSRQCANAQSPWRCLQRLAPPRLCTPPLG